MDRDVVRLTIPPPPAKSEPPAGWARSCPDCGELFVALEQKREVLSAASGMLALAPHFDLQVECALGHVWRANSGVRTADSGYGFKLIGRVS
jgi:hypothetical protein